MLQKRFLISLSLCLCAGIVAAQGQNPPAGEYIFERGSGVLNVKPNGTFDISTIGPNAHLCELDGRIVRGKAKLDDSPCVVDFATHGKTVVVTTNAAEQCRDNCGARATFEGTYTRPTPACTHSAVSTSRKRFKQQFDAKNYAVAEGTLSAVLSECEKTLDWLSAGRIRNDLALTQSKRGDKAACLRTLQPLAEDAAKTDDGIKESYPPADAEDYLPIVKATRFNLKMCAG
ncbi:hypothetical protein [Variovorax ginsengisoli]|uniref:Uncharacterized protein n=1 Tax=Variovorax ginsengisoli TaxID=363844 RepID=A0ABT9S6C7_9BURK|nr:hypothetical protein [Variovorax ginsengisoli]MDP9898897.1 hypothetical protein [Variovorax ginsengisoli]